MAFSPLRLTIISCSLDPQSRSRKLARQARQLLEAQDHQVSFFDLRETPLPAFDNEMVYQDETVQRLYTALSESDGVLLAVPVYNWSVGSAVKNLIEITGSTDEARGLKSAWFDRVVTFLVAGGLPHSYMAHTSLAASLMLDFKCILNPYHVYTTAADWQGETLSDPLAARLDKTLAVQVELSARLRGRTYHSDWEI